jgi:hypothetical protein
MSVCLEGGEIKRERESDCRNTKRDSLPFPASKPKSRKTKETRKEE